MRRASSAWSASRREEKVKRRGSNPFDPGMKGSTREELKMRKLTHFFFLFSTLSAFVACSGGEDSLGTRSNNSQQGDDKCEGPNPASLSCADGKACPSGYACDPNACLSSHCSCDAASKNWQCTTDCGLGGACVPEGSTPICEARNPSLGCESGCPTGTVCDADACRPSSCTCGDNGEWLCTRDCGGRGVCAPDPGPSQCEGPNPAMGCENGCPSGTVCDYGACRSSGCSCDPVTGAWACTADCGSGGTCVPTESASCGGALGKHAPEGDALCAGKADCSTTDGVPDHQGCPNTCNCVCFHGMCFSGACTDMACTEPNDYR
jgi:hypothetical protein